jgi:hypothetical protein
MDLYKAYAIRMVSTFLKGVKIDPDSIGSDELINKRIEACIGKLNEYIAYKEKIDKLVTMLRENISDVDQYQ